MEVSIHALLAECDPGEEGFKVGILLFQSTHSLRSATRPPDSGRVKGFVSIHALLAECDALNVVRDFQRQGFQSTHSLRSATP